jgi:type IV secretory pathway TrbD component
MSDQSTHTLLVRALTEPILIMGIPREMAILNGMVHILFVQITKSLPCVIIALITYPCIHMATKAAAKKDPGFFACFKRFIKQKKYYGV